MNLRPNVCALLAVAILAAFAGMNALRPLLDADTGWHLRIGRFIDANGTVPYSDPISREGIENQMPWQAYSRLHEWILYRAHILGGESGVFWMRSTLVALSTAAAFAFVFGRFGWSLAAFPLAFGLATTLAPMASERPWHYTIAFTALTLRIVQGARETGSARRAFLLIPIFALWANLHIQFVLGWIVLGLWCVSPGVANRRIALLVTAGCVVATFANPYHVRLLAVIWDYATQAAPRGLIQELAPPSIRSLYCFSVVSLAAIAVVGILSRRTSNAFEIGLLVAVAFVGLRMNRDLWFGALLAIAAIRPAPGHPPARAIPIVATVGAVLIAMRLFWIQGWLGDNDSAAAQARAYPAAGIEYLKSARPAGPLFNDITWGGYLAWAIPEYPVSIDGRTNLYGNERLLQSSWTWSTVDGWKSDGAFAKCNIVLARVGRPLTNALRALPNEWRIVHEDAVAVVFVRR